MSAPTITDISDETINRTIRENAQILSRMADSALETGDIHAWAGCIGGAHLLGAVTCTNGEFGVEYGEDLDIVEDQDVRNVVKTLTTFGNEAQDEFEAEPFHKDAPAVQALALVFATSAALILLAFNPSV